jgi:hypothetical protein
MDFLYPSLDIHRSMRRSHVWPCAYPTGSGFEPQHPVIENVEIRMDDLVDIAIPANAQAAAEALGLRVTRSVTSGARVRQIPREDAEIAIECLRDWGFSGRIIEDNPHGMKPAA